MTICNMIVEAGARGALVAPDDKRFRLSRRHARGRRRRELGHAPATAGSTLRSDADGGVRPRDRDSTPAEIEPLVSWGTSPDQVVAIRSACPTRRRNPTPPARSGMQRALEYMDLEAGHADATQSRSTAPSSAPAPTPASRICAPPRSVLAGRQVAEARAGHGRARLQPGDAREAEAEGLDRIFTEAGFEWRQSGCSMCLAMNDDVLAPGERCASSTNRNFEGRQGRGGRTHLMSPAMVAAAADQRATSPMCAPSTGAAAMRTLHRNQRHSRAAAAGKRRHRRRSCPSSS